MVVLAGSALDLLGRRFVSLIVVWSVVSSLCSCSRIGLSYVVRGDDQREESLRGSVAGVIICAGKDTVKSYANHVDGSFPMMQN